MLFRSLAVGATFSMGLKADGTVWTWGNNEFGQLGNGRFTGTATYPRKLSGLENIIKIAAAGYSAYALDKDGKVYAWGKNNCGQLGIGKDTTANKTIDQCTPQAVLTQDGAEELSGIVAIAAGGNSDTSTFALALDGAEIGRASCRERV